jgi:hypothetical protein
MPSLLQTTCQSISDNCRTIASLVLALAFLLLPIPSATARDGHAEDVQITSKSTVESPDRLRFTVRASAAHERIALRVDGHRRWVRRPSHRRFRHSAYLHTLRLRPGRHRLEVTATRRSGRVTEAVRVVRVAPPVPGSASGAGDVIFDGDFSRGLAAWSTKINEKAISVVDDPILGSKRKVAKFTVHDNDMGPGENPRAQIEGPANLVPGGEYWAGWSTLLPADFPTIPSGGWLTLQSIYGAPFAGAGPLGTRLGANELQFQRNATYNWDLPWRQTIQRGRWTDFVYHVKLSPDPTVGFVELYLNTGNGWAQQTLGGQNRLYMKTLDSTNGAGPNSFRVNNYRKQGMFDVATLYHATPKVGTSFDAVAPNSH